MQTNLKLVVGGIAGMLGAVGLAAGLIACASTETEQRALERAETRETEPIESPELEPELATTTNLPSVREVAPRVEPIEAVDEHEPVLATGDVRVRRLIVATGIERHEPTGASDQFEIGAQQRIYAFVDAVNETDEPVELFVTFEPERGERAGHVALDVPANVSRFRTWAWTRHVYTEGRWEVVVRDADDRVIARRAFDVVR